MDKPGLQRAIPYMLLAFIGSLLLVYAIRSAQQMDPVWISDDSTAGAQVGMVLAAFASMGAFMWGIGAFDPKMSEHGDHAEEHAEEDAPEKEFTLDSSGWFFYLGHIQWKFGMSLLAIDPSAPKFQLPDNGNVVSMAIGYFLWFPLFVALTVFGLITKVVASLAKLPFNSVQWMGNFVLNGLFTAVWALIWFGLIYVPSRLTLGSIAGLWLTLGVPIMALSWIAQLVRFYAGQVLGVMTLSIVMIIAIFGFALFPHGWQIQTTTEPNGNVFDNGFGLFTVPTGEIAGLINPTTEITNQPIENTSQFSIFIGFILIVFISLAIAAGGLALLFYLAHRGVKEVTELETTDKDRTQITPIREVGSIAGGVANAIRAIPNAIGYKK